MKYLKLMLSVLSIVLVSSCSQPGSPEWSPKESALTTKWAKDVDPVNPWDKYPRPGMVRSDWLNLNGLWDYSVCARDSFPTNWEGKILVPYPVESALSGVMQRLNQDQLIWYKRNIKIPRAWKNKNILLNFEAADWETTVYIDGKKAGMHRGAYDPFSFDISKYVVTGKTHELVVSVCDPTDKGTQARGKQVTKPGGIWYTPSSGIWQTVWIEPINESYIESVKVQTDIDSGTISLSPVIISRDENLIIKAEVSYDDLILATAEAKAGEIIRLNVDNYKLWSPDNPVLYDLNIQLIADKAISDKVRCYTGFRKVSLGKTDDGYTRIFLNNKFVFQNGPLDQGFWPDGLYTPPTEDAMLYDLQMIKEMGFNMLRKHVKIENRRFYYWCDKMGLLVWQDMPSGDKYIHGDMDDIEKNEDDATQFKKELAAMINTKYNNPSIIIWVPFNEGWGQYDTGGISEYIKGLDPTRLVNSASGWTDRGTGDIYDIHHYPEPKCPEPEANRAIVLGEFGGLGLPIQDHTWEHKNWGYRNMKSADDLLREYEYFYTDISKFVDKGLSAVIYTQITDVETETNGLLTYDRAVDKMGKEKLFKINTGVVQ